MKKKIKYKGFELSKDEFAAIRRFEEKTGYMMSRAGMQNWLRSYRLAMVIKKKIADSD